MVGFDRGQTLAERFRTHAGAQTTLYGHVLRAMADDLEAGGPTATVVQGYRDAPVGAVIQLRLLAGIFRLVLTGRAPQLRPYYPCLGGRAPAAEAWPVMRAVIAEHTEELHDALAIAPQTNEVGRSVALLLGLWDLAAATGWGRIRLLELGASAGLNLLLPRFRVEGEGWSWGPAGSPVRLTDVVEGTPAAAAVEIVSARGCDLDPVDATSAEGRLRLTSFVWPFDVHRHERLAGALQIAGEHPPVVDRAPASTWLAEQLAGAGPAATLTVVWHSVTQLYWPAAELAAVEDILVDHGRRWPLGEVGMEYEPAGRAGERPWLWTRSWAGSGADPVRRRLGTAHDHGIPVRLVPPE